MKVEDVMTKDVASCGPDDVLAVPARVMWEHDCGMVPVVDADKKVLGVLTDRDICMSALIEGKSLHDLLVVGRALLDQHLAQFAAFSAGRLQTFEHLLLGDRAGLNQNLSESLAGFPHAFVRSNPTPRR